MNKPVIATLAAVGAVAVGIVLFRVRREPTPQRDTGAPATRADALAQQAATTRPAIAQRPPPPAPVPPEGLSPEEKAAWVNKIKRDYEEIRTKASADYSAAGTSFPGGLNAFLRQLALLEREKRADLAAILTPEELEDLELRESTAGQMVQRLLGDTTATEQQRRAVFRLQRAFEDRFALTFDLTPRALLARETARQQVQEQIRAVLGDSLFPSWLRGEGPDFERLATFVSAQGLAPSVALDVWRVRNEFTRRRLELAANPAPSSDQQRAAQIALAQQTEARLMAVVGQGTVQAGRATVFGWLPRK